MSDRRVITLAGVGNRGMADDGIGLVILESLLDKLTDDIDVKFWEHNDALSIAAELLEIQTPIVIIDCADMGLQGGAFRWFKRSECQLSDDLQTLSTHGFGFADALALADALGFEQHIFFFAIQPVKFEFNSKISPVLEKKTALMADSLLEQVHQLKAQLNKS